MKNDEEQTNYNEAGCNYPVDRERGTHERELEIRVVIQNKKLIHFYQFSLWCCDTAACQRFENVTKFGLEFVALPISNANVNVVSIYNIVKNIFRNTLSIEMLRCMMMVQITLNRNGSCTSIKISQNVCFIRICMILKHSNLQIKGKFYLMYELVFKYFYKIVFRGF